MKIVKDYKERLEESIEKCMTEWNISERSASAIDQMVQCWLHISKMCEHTENAALTPEETRKWVAGLENEDGSSGGHWNIAQTNSAAESIGVRFEHITPEEWNLAMNMMYSDYCGVANKYGVGMSDFFAEMAKAFLFDKDAGSPKAKLEGYYKGVVEREK